MDWNAVFNRAVESAFNAKKDDLINQTLKEDHDYIMFNLKKIFDETYKHLNNYLLGVADSDDVVGALKIVKDFMNKIEETVTGEKIKNEEVLTDDDETVMVDNEGTINIPARVFKKVNFTDREFVKIVGDGDGLYIYKPKNFRYDMEWIKDRLYNPNHSFKLSVSNLLGVEPGDVLKVTAVEDGKIAIKVITDIEEDEVTRFTEKIETFDVIVDSGNRINIPNRAIKEADLENILLYFFKEGNHIIITPKEQIFKYMDNIKMVQEKLYIYEGKPLRIGVGKMLGTKTGNIVRVEVCEGQINMWKVNED